MKPVIPAHNYQLDPLQRIATSLMAALVLLTFVGANMQALLWQSSDWLVSTVLPAVVVDLTNHERTDQAATPLQRNDKLDAAARLKAQHMADNEYFAHFAPDGTTPWSFFREAGYVYAHAGENLAIHFTDSTEVVEAWMQSPAHRKNIVDQKFTQIGVGTAKGMFEGYETVYVVQLFGAPAVAPSTPAPLAAATVPEAVLEPNLADELAVIQAEIDTITSVLAQANDAPEEVAVATTPAAAVPDPELLEVVVQPAALSVPVEPPVAIEFAPNDTVIVSSQLATSSGLAIASLVEPAQAQAHAGATLAAVATQPNVLLNIVYTAIVGVIIVLLVLSLLGEARRLHVVQVAYSLALLLVIGGLWYAHTLLTTGAIIA